MDLGNSIGMDGSWRIEPNDGDSLKATMPWDDLARKGGSLGQAEYGVHSLQPVNPIGEASTSAVGLFSTPVKETRRGDILRDKREKEKRPMPTAVWADLMDTSKGRDKVLVSGCGLHHPQVCTLTWSGEGQRPHDGLGGRGRQDRR